MSETIRIIQITDCHLPADPEQEYRGQNPHENLKTLLQIIPDYSPDLILATGDLSEEASPASYRTLQGYFNQLEIPVLALPGNHDDPRLLANLYPGSPVDKVEVSEHGEWQIIRLNSCLEGKPEGRINPETLAELGQVLSHEARRPRLIALHHQPVPVGSPWIDKYQLLEQEQLLHLLGQCPGVRAVVWGHIHHDYTKDKDGVAMLGCPSTSANSLPGTLKFTADGAGPACRWLELGAGGVIGNGIIKPGASRNPATTTTG